MSVGNDIIDLLDPESDPSSLHPRYLDRVFTFSEREGLPNDPDRLELWSRWAAKEAAFKALAAHHPGLAFLPRTFVTSLGEPAAANGQRLGWVDHGRQRIRVVLHHWGNVLHAIAATAGELDDGQLLAEVAPITDDEDPSSAVRRVAISCLAQNLGGDERQVQIRGRRPPHFFIGEKPAALSLSLSHHGAWVAFACCVEESPEFSEFSEFPNPTHQAVHS